jgi:hypothetical protein
MSIDQQNIHNLTALWNKYGTKSIAHEGNSTLLATLGWPYRSWLEGENNLALQISATPKSHRITSWPYPLPKANNVAPISRLDENWHLEFEQTAMYLKLNEITLPTEQQNNLDLRIVKDAESLTQWLQISSEAFGYEMDQEVFKPLLTDCDIEIYLGYLNQKPAVSALLYKTGNVTGLHQMGVKKAFQGQNAAKSAMYLLLARAQQQRSEFMVLQASKMGLPLYLKLGFQAQFKLLNFHFVEENSDA